MADNGSGVAPPNYQALTLKYHTSKLGDFEDLQVQRGAVFEAWGGQGWVCRGVATCGSTCGSMRAAPWRHSAPRPCAPAALPTHRPPPTHPQELSTFGFRGEALSSLCAVADVSVVTRTAEQEVGVRLRCGPCGSHWGGCGAGQLAWDGG